VGCWGHNAGNPAPAAGPARAVEAGGPGPDGQSRALCATRRRDGGVSLGMGISGLLGLLKGAQESVHVSKHSGKRAAIDAYCWLHKGAYAASRELCESIPTTKPIEYCMDRIYMLQHNNIIPVVVFDGDRLPMKRGEEEKRQRNRRDNLAKARAHVSAGNLHAANEAYQRAVDISPSLAYELIKVLKSKSIEFVVAPFEADAQIAYLCQTGYCDFAITEDSDLIAFGCDVVLFKMSRFGEAMEYRFDALHKVKELRLGHFTKDNLLDMCILSGCDYLPCVPGVGLKRAHTLLTKHKTAQRVIWSLRVSGKYDVPNKYEESFRRAKQTFLHQRIFAVKEREAMFRNAVSEDMLNEDLSFLGPETDADLVLGICEGRVCPLEKKDFEEMKLTNATSQSAMTEEKQRTSSVLRLQLPVSKVFKRHTYDAMTAIAAKPFKMPRKSIVAQRLESAAAGTKSILSFFSQKRSVDSNSSLESFKLDSVASLPTKCDGPKAGAKQSRYFSKGEGSGSKLVVETTTEVHRNEEHAQRVNNEAIDVTTETSAVREEMYSTMTTIAKCCIDRIDVAKDGDRPRSGVVERNQQAQANLDQFRLV